MASNRHTADTTLAELGLSAWVVANLSEAGIYRLADFSEVNVREMSSTWGVGRTSIERVRLALESLGWKFKEDANPDARACDRNRESLTRGGMAYGPDTPLDQVDISGGLFLRCLKSGIDTPRDLFPDSARRLRPIRKISSEGDSGNHHKGRPYLAEQSNPSCLRPPSTT